MNAAERQGQAHLENDHPHCGGDCTGRRLRAIAAHSFSVPAMPAAEAGSGNARYEAVPFADLPGWNHALMAPSLRALFRRLQAASAAPASSRRRARPVTSARTREFFEANFSPYAADLIRRRGTAA